MNNQEVTKTKKPSNQQAFQETSSKTNSSMPEGMARGAR